MYTNYKEKLEAKEIEFLKALKESFGEYASKKYSDGLSKIDKEDEEKVVQIKSRVLQQCQKDLDFTLKFSKFQIRYIKLALQNMKIY